MLTWWLNKSIKKIKIVSQTNVTCARHKYKKLVKTVNMPAALRCVNCIGEKQSYRNFSASAAHVKDYVVIFFSILVLNHV